jgi:hypothetical protein
MSKHDQGGAVGRGLKDGRGARAGQSQTAARSVPAGPAAAGPGKPGERTGGAALKRYTDRDQVRSQGSAGPPPADPFPVADAERRKR